MKKGYLLIALLMLSMFLVSGCYSQSSGYSQGSSSVDAKSVFTNIVTLKFMSDIGLMKETTNLGVEPIVGFIRFLLLILLFGIFFKGAEYLKLGKNVAIVIALVFSLICTIFIPGTILLAMVASYSTLVSLILLGLPVGLAVAGYFMLKDHHWIRAGIMALLLLCVDQMGKVMNGMGATMSQESAALGVVINTVGSWINVVWLIVLILAVLSLIQGLIATGKGYSGKDVDLGKTGKTLWNFFQNSNRRKKTALMNEYVEEEKELKMLDNVVELRDKAEVEIEEIISRKSITDKQKIALVKTIKEIEKKLKEARNEFRRIKGRTWRQEKGFDKLIKEFKEKNKDVSELQTFENEILEEHKKAIKGLNDIITGNSFATLMTATDELDTYAFSAGKNVASVVNTNDSPGKELDTIKTSLASVDVTAIDTAQRKAITALNAVILKARELMKWK